MCSVFYFEGGCMENFYWDGIGQKTVLNKRTCLWSRSDQISYNERWLTSSKKGQLS